MFYQIIKLLLKPLFNIFYVVRVEGLDNLPEENGYIVCGNHARVIDPILLGVNMPKKIYFMAKNELFKNKLVAFVLKGLGAFPVKRGEADLKSIKTSLKLLQTQQNIGIFPEGTRNTTGELKAEPGIAMLAIKSKRPIVPVAIKTDYKIFHRTDIVIGKAINLSEHFDTKLKNEDYKDISLEIMKKIKKL
ncbi:lysophospholipid acyltransferase family protein [Lutispora sp.]|uniref:lysophospholipid acyltransferase family protein n=1 Tax=Lutispora sp. TaxID=2828727 RepID=UPI002B1F77F7|nr:lysophospholipid acyltransferase family protein [Lutispora sp.]MEA4963950.1 lysophospholipid acyltransferase family protein [Lutispora sp.]